MRGGGAIADQLEAETEADEASSVASAESISVKRVRLDSVVTRPSGTRAEGGAESTRTHRLANWLLVKGD